MLRVHRLIHRTLSTLGSGFVSSGPVDNTTIVDFTRVELNAGRVTAESTRIRKTAIPTRSKFNTLNTPPLIKQTSTKSLVAPQINLPQEKGDSQFDLMP